MIAKFPSPEGQIKPLKVEISLHGEDSDKAELDTREWVRWVFQSIRVRCQGIVFYSSATDRTALLEDWNKFVVHSWETVLAPSLLQAWQNASEGDQRKLLEENKIISQQLQIDACGRSLEAGAILLKKTSGAKYQGVLGRLREAFVQEASEAHAAIVWSAISVVFQLPIADVLIEYLREEWFAGSQSCHHRDEPQGPQSFSALTHRAMREGKMVHFETGSSAS